MNFMTDEPSLWLSHSVQGVAAVQAQLRKTAPPLRPGMSAPAVLSPRYPVTRGVFAIPILHDASPDKTGCAEGITIDVSRDSVTFELAATTRPASPKWLLGVERSDGELAFVTVASQSVQSAGLGLRVSAMVVDAARDPLSDANLTPAFDASSFTFRTKLAPAVLDQWLALGVLQTRLLDRVLVCPRCRSLPTFRRGCRACGSIEVSSQRLIHHFACAHVDFVASFEYETEMICPKCRVRQLVIGADFEYLAGPFQCADCQWSDAELATIARCAACGDEFGSDEALEEEVMGYHVARLELLDLVAAD